MTYKVGQIWQGRDSGFLYVITMLLPHGYVQLVRLANLVCQDIPTDVVVQYAEDMRWELIDDV